MPFDQRLHRRTARPLHRFHLVAPDSFADQAVTHAACGAPRPDPALLVALRQPTGWPAASARTVSVVSASPAMPQSPLRTSSSTHHVTPRMFSPSTDTMASV